MTEAEEVELVNTVSWKVTRTVRKNGQGKEVNADKVKAIAGLYGCKSMTYSTLFQRSMELSTASFEILKKWRRTSLWQ